MTACTRRQSEGVEKETYTNLEVCCTFLRWCVNDEACGFFDNHEEDLHADLLRVEGRDCEQISVADVSRPFVPGEPWRSKWSSVTDEKRALHSSVPSQRRINLNVSFQLYKPTSGSFCLDLSVHPRLGMEACSSWMQRVARRIFCGRETMRATGFPAFKFFIHQVDYLVKTDELEGQI